jgi:methyltransferase family protein
MEDSLKMMKSEEISAGMEMRENRAQIPAPARDLAAYRNSAKEQNRIRSLFNLVPLSGSSAVDIGARDGYLSLRLAERFDSVVALDLKAPDIAHPLVECVAGDVTRLQIPDNSFQLVLCAEVLEHIPPAGLAQACSEIARIAKDAVVIGVPYRQDTRHGRTTCVLCGCKNPPWGHANRFDEDSLRTLFRGLRIERIEYVGKSLERTNFISAFLMDLAGNPYGTYDQDEGCVECGARLQAPARRNLMKKAATFAALRLTSLVNRFYSPQATWIHVLFRKDGT